MMKTRGARIITLLITLASTQQAWAGCEDSLFKSFTKSIKKLVDNTVEVADAKYKIASNRVLGNVERGEALLDIIQLYKNRRLERAQIEDYLLRLCRYEMPKEMQEIVWQWFAENGGIKSIDRMIAFLKSLGPSNVRYKNANVVILEDVLLEIMVRTEFTEAGAKYLDDLGVRHSLLLAVEEDMTRATLPVSEESLKLRHKIYGPFLFQSHVVELLGILTEYAKDGNALPLKRYMDRELSSERHFATFGTLAIDYSPTNLEGIVRSGDPVARSLYLLLCERMNLVLRATNKTAEDYRALLANSTLAVFAWLSEHPQVVDRPGFMEDYLMILSSMKPGTDRFFATFFPQALPFLTARTPEQVHAALEAGIDLSSRSFWFKSLVPRQTPEKP